MFSYFSRVTLMTKIQVAVFGIFSISVVPDLKTTNELMNAVEQSSITEINSSPLIELLAGENQNSVIQDGKTSSVFSKTIFNNKYDINK